MNNSKRVVINTLAQYGRTVFNMLLSLYTVRIVLTTLGSSDYGIYTVIAGVTSMLAFMTNAMVSTTQRFMSYYQGKQDINKMKEVFSNSEILHLVVGVFFVVSLLSLKEFLFNGFLNIPNERIDAAIYIYILVIIILFVTFCSAPFRALLVSHENIVYISIIDVLDAIFKVILVTLLPYADHDKLIMYGYILLLMQIFNFTAFSLYSFRKYTECILPKISLFSRQYIRELLSYAGWVMYGMGCVVGRSQGIAIVLNRFLGTIANAAYGLGFQISSAVSTISIAFLNAMRPQIVKSEGAGNRKRALRLSCMLCKFSFFLLSALCVPIVFEMPQILGLWLKDIPQYTILFARMALIAGMVDTFTLGLSVTNEAVGNIRKYNITISSMKLITLPATWICLHYDLELVWVAIFYIAIEFISAFSRIPFIHFTAGLDITAFLKNNCLRVLMPMALFLIANVLIVSFMNMTFRFVITIVVSCSVYAISAFAWGLNEEEKNYLLSFVRHGK